MWRVQKGVVPCGWHLYKRMALEGGSPWTCDADEWCVVNDVPMHVSASWAACERAAIVDANRRGARAQSARTAGCADACVYNACTSCVSRVCGEDKQRECEMGCEKCMCMQLWYEYVRNVRIQM